MIGSVLVGYIAFASFLVDQLVWISDLLALLLLAIVLVDEFIGGTLREQTRIATALQANTGLRRRSLAQIGVLATGIARVLLILIAGMLALAPWGIESADLLSSLRAAFLGFKVGDVTISLSAIAIAALIFALGFTVTRVVQRWLDTTYLPATDLDAGLRNSIRTAAGYFGVIVSGAVAFSYLGLSLDRLAIVAGALSVGIGFGLQSIVNNFVSGLILLWERPIRVGDLVVVGDGEGYVRRINVRATEIETFDRSTVIVPNSNLISGVVRNRVRSDRTGRVIAPVSVPRTADPVRAAEIIAECARAHAEVLKEPPPRVLFKKIGETPGLSSTSSASWPTSTFPGARAERVELRLVPAPHGRAHHRAAGNTAGPRRAASARRAVPRAHRPGDRGPRPGKAASGSGDAGRGAAEREVVVRQRLRLSPPAGRGPPKAASLRGRRG